MQYLSIVFGFAALASAIDIRLHSASNCKSWSTDCSNINPNVCCAGFSAGFSYPSIRFASVPRSWNIEVKGYNWENGKYCADLVAVQIMSGTTDRCVEGLRFGGAGYNFRGKKRGVDAAAEAPARKCTSSQKADVLTLENGNRYNIGSMQDGLLNDLVALAVNGTTAEDILGVFKAYEYKK